MAITALADFVFSDQHGGGWTENFYLTASTISTALQNLSTTAFLRRKMLAQGYHLDEVRVSDVAVFRDSLVKAYAGPPGDGLFPLGTVPVDGNEQVFDRLLLRIEGTSLTRRTMELGGIPRGVFDQNRRYTPTPAWTAAFNAWVQNMLDPSGPVLIRRANRLATTNVLGLTPSTGTGIAMTVIVPNTWAAGPSIIGKQVRLSKFRGTAKINGLWTVFNQLTDTPLPGQTTLYLQAKRSRPLLDAVSILGQISTVASGTYIAITNIIPLRGVRRSTGRPLDSLRGRQPTR